MRFAKSNRGFIFDGQYTRQPREYIRWGGLWVGGVVGRDTLVSTGVDDTWSLFNEVALLEFWPAATSEIIRRSVNISDPFYSPLAVSEQDMIVTYYDTLASQGITGFDFVEGRSHIPLNLKVEERSYQWSYDYADDFILLDYTITNIGDEDIRDVYLGFWVDGDTFFGVGGGSAPIVGSQEFTNGTNTDDLVGFKKTFPAECNFIDTLNVAYIMDNDGDPNIDGNWMPPYSLRHVVGVRILQKPSSEAQTSFNWWTFSFQNSFGPRSVGTPELPFRNMDNRLGIPFGDKNKYYIMRNLETDYDQVETFLDHTAEGFLPPPARAAGISRGAEIRMLMSVGPVSLFAGQSIPFTVAIIGGENIHRQPDNFENLFDPVNPDVFLKSLDFSSLQINSRWAGWVYDNPGTDTDNDGFRGKFRDCVLGTTTQIDTIFAIDSSQIPFDTSIVSIDTSEVPSEIRRQFYEGDGRPDFRATAPPPAPRVRVIPGIGTLTLRWNGFASETTPDPLTGLVDFEGYRVYSSATKEISEFVLHTSFDRANFNRFEYDDLFGGWTLPTDPFTIQELEALYGAGFDPLQHTLDDPLVFPDPQGGGNNVFYFTQQDWNRSELNVPGAISKRFPSVPDPGIDKDLWTAADLTEDGLPKFWEYEFTLSDLLPSAMLYVTVTAFDYGSRSVSLSSLETNPLINAVEAFPLPAANNFVDKELEVVVYPNPYRIDGRYRDEGFEGRGLEALPDERARAVNFANLPPKCSIRIYSLDGDLVREILHDKDPADATAMHEFWDIISRNLLPVVSGIYYWTVETPDGRSQIGKLVLIM